jgi:hypothetical protein
MDHKPAFDFTDTSPDHIKTRIHTNEFTIGNINLEDDVVDMVNRTIQSEETQSKKKRNQISNYEFIIHKIVQYDVRKYPDEIVAKNVVIHGIFF